MKKIKSTIKKESSVLVLPLLMLVVFVLTGCPDADEPAAPENFWTLNGAEGGSLSLSGDASLEKGILEIGLDGGSAVIPCDFSYSDYAVSICFRTTKAEEVSPQALFAAYTDGGYQMLFAVFGSYGSLSEPGELRYLYRYPRDDESAASSENLFTSADDSVVYNDGQWHRAVIGKTGEKIYMYVDGEFACNGTRDQEADDETLKIVIGSLSPSNSSYNFQGQIKELRIFDHSLSEEEILALMQTGE